MTDEARQRKAVRLQRAYAKNHDAEAVHDAAMWLELGDDMTGEPTPSEDTVSRELFSARMTWTFARVA